MLHYTVVQSDQKLKQSNSYMVIKIYKQLKTSPYEAQQIQKSPLLTSDIACGLLQ